MLSYVLVQFLILDCSAVGKVEGVCNLLQWQQQPCSRSFANTHSSTVSKAISSIVWAGQDRHSGARSGYRRPSRSEEPVDFGVAYK